MSLEHQGTVHSHLVGLRHIQSDAVEAFGKEAVQLVRQLPFLHDARDAWQQTATLHARVPSWQRPRSSLPVMTAQLSCP